MNQTFLIVGLGSMGKRRIRNLRRHGENNILGFDRRPDRRAEAQAKYGITIVDDFNQVRPEDFTALIISTSPEAHGDYIRYALQRQKHFFVEHPTSADGYEEIFKHRNTPTVKAPSCTMRFYAPIKMLKEILTAGKIGKILAFQYHMGQYLPDWHPWEDYRQVYFAQKSTSACREMFAFELIWLNWLMGAAPVDVRGVIAKVSDLDMPADDVVLANVKYDNGIRGNLLIDVIARQPLRTLRVLGATGVLDWERFAYQIKVFDVQSKTTDVIDVPRGQPEIGYVNEEEMYNDEIKAFLDAIAGRAPYPFTFEENLVNLRLLFKLIKSSE
ncbi:MAG: Gfo/Idh/MocA family oxidoreductase [Candidatus Magasanikbacteria bacterium]|nr:Gfo/Idh/MocA family oxidoreductase [Candidatus Magasanikbacteria bacterium]